MNGYLSLSGHDNADYTGNWARGIDTHFISRIAIKSFQRDSDRHLSRPEVSAYATCSPAALSLASVAVDFGSSRKGIQFGII